MQCADNYYFFYPSQSMTFLIYDMILYNSRSLHSHILVVLSVLQPGLRCIFPSDVFQAWHHLGPHPVDTASFVDIYTMTIAVTRKTQACLPPPCKPSVKPFRPSTKASSPHPPPLISVANLCGVVWCGLAWPACVAHSPVLPSRQPKSRRSYGCRRCKNRA